MPTNISFDNITLSVSGKASPSKPREDTPFRILVLADFSGRESRGVCESLAGRRAASVDIDNIDAVLARMKPALSLPDGIAISFASLDDFHPDRIFDRVPIFQKLRETRAALRDPASAAHAAAEVASWAGPATIPAPAEKSSESDAETLARLLGGEPREMPRQASVAAGGIQDLIRKIVAPHVVASADPNVAAMTSAVDAAIGAQMRAILHQPAFQALEAAWRGVDFLVRNLDTDETLTIHILDASKAELAADLRGADDLARSAIFTTLVEETVHSPGGEPWVLIVGDYTFGSGEEDAELLARIAKVSASAGAPFLAGAANEFIEAAVANRRDATEAWQAVRTMREASSVGLAVPRFLLRLPYGPDTEPVERFDFEEMPGPPAHDAFLWGNAAFACACLLGQSFRENEWDMSPGDAIELGGLPVHPFSEDGEMKMMPCAGRWLTDGHADNLLAFGIMPLVSIRGRDAVRVVRFQSIAQPAAALAGRWS